MRVLVAPDKFKGSLAADRVAVHLQAGLLRAGPATVVKVCPIADGGEGTVDAVVAAGFQRIDVRVEGPTGVPVTAGFAERDGTAVIELAQSNGLALLPGGVPAPMVAGTRGVGQLIRAALDRGCRGIVLGLGGSSATDGGAGMLGALGARLLDARGRCVGGRGSEVLKHVSSLDLSGLDPRLREVEFVVACDVDNPLHGPTGAAVVYGPQKGADPEQVRELDQRLRRWANVVERGTGRDLADRAGAGAAGGVGFAAMSMLDATRRSGADMVFELTGLPDMVADADLIITGEGCLDSQTLRGKGPVGVARRGRDRGVPVVAVVGRDELTDTESMGAGFARVYRLVDVEPDGERCRRRPEEILETIGTVIGREWRARLRDRSPGGAGEKS